MYAFISGRVCTIVYICAIRIFQRQKNLKTQNMSNINQTVQSLVANGDIKRAIQVLIDANVDGAILLSSRFNNAKKKYDMGEIAFADWGLEQNRITNSILELAKMGAPSAPNAPVTVPSATTTSVPSTPAPTAPKTLNVFISYNHGDREAVDKIQAFLVSRGVSVTRDRDNMEAGERISDFIKDGIKESKFVVSVVSERSLQSGWVGTESVAASFASWLTDQCFIPVGLDHKLFDDNFYIEALTTINQKIAQKEANATQVKELGGDSAVITKEIKRLYDLKTNLGNILDRLRESLVIDLSGDAASFDNGMTKVLERIQKG
jgi:hypothetical protein